MPLHSEIKLEPQVHETAHDMFPSLIFHDRQLRRVMKEYATYYNVARPHQGIRQKIPAW